ncbi:hypothetical protein [Halosimplex amylolyticum]|uniref:hypothetical protein n=1 Tax=Halosimplex amylolyticum TaxID=3396616 RepID=UPI003F54993C
MPSTNQAGGRDFPAFDNIEADIGHNPARYLDWDFLAESYGDRDIKSGRKLLLKARIRGIDRIEVVRAYKAVERAIGRGPAGGPREAVMRLLDQREQFLQEAGERPERLSYGPRRPPESYATETDDERDEQPLTAAEKLSRMRSGRVATDGGERDGE